MRAFCRALARAMAGDESIPFGSGRLQFRHTAAYAELAGAIGDEVRHPPLEQSNTGVFFGERLYLKGYRRLQSGPSPEVEVGNFLTAATPFPHVARVAGWAEYVDADGVTTTLALLQQYVDHQGNLWDYTLDYLDRYVDLRAGSAVGAAPEPAEEDLHRGFVAQAKTLGRRIGELHRAFATATGSHDFDPEPVEPYELRDWRATVHADVDRTLKLLAARRDSIAASVQPAADKLLAERNRLAAFVRRHPLPTRTARKDPLPRRPAPRPGAGRPERFRDHRFRGRAGAIGRRTPPQALAAPGRRRHGPLGGLRGADRRRAAQLADRATTRAW